MIILGIILLVAGLLVGKLAVLVTIGIILIVIGLIFAIAGHAGHAVYGRRHWY
jgi:membrane-bound ClpP family serine protease